MADREKTEREPGKSPGKGKEHEKKNPGRQREPGKSPDKEGDKERGGRRRGREDEDAE